MDPKPVQDPHVPIIVGGHGARSLRRAAQFGSGWYGFALTPEATDQCLRGLDQARSQVDRRSDLGELEISVTPLGRLTPADVEAFLEGLDPAE